MTIFVEIINIPVVDMYKTNVSQTTENIEIFSRSPFSQAVCIKRALYLNSIEQYECYRKIGRRHEGMVSGMRNRGLNKTDNRIEHGVNMQFIIMGVVETLATFVKLSIKPV